MLLVDNWARHNLTLYCIGFLNDTEPVVALTPDDYKLVSGRFVSEF